MKTMYGFSAHIAAPAFGGEMDLMSAMLRQAAWDRLQSSDCAACRTVPDRGSVDRDQHLAGSGFGNVHLLDDEPVRSSALVGADRQDITKLVLSEAPIPDPSIYQFPALTAAGPAAWNFGYFALTNGLPEDMVSGRETTWTDKFIDSHEYVKGAVTPDEVQVFAHYLKDDAHL